MSNEENKMEIVSGNVKDLEISPVYEHLSVAKPKVSGDAKKIVIPEVKKKKEKKEDTKTKDDLDKEENDDDTNVNKNN